MTRRIEVKLLGVTLFSIVDNADPPAETVPQREGAIDGGIIMDGTQVRDEGIGFRRTGIENYDEL